jgi:hypothetical protein
MEMQSVQSSQIAQVGHDGQSNLRVLFRRGGLYEYQGVTAEEFREMLSAESLGSYFSQRIKGARPFTKVSESFVTSIDQKPGLPSAADLDAVAEEQKIADATGPSPEVEKVAAQSSALVVNAKSIKVIDAATQSQANELLLSVAAMRKQVENTFAPMKDAAHKAHKVICEQEKKVDAPLVEAERILKSGIGEFVQEQRRLARVAEEEQRKVEMERARLESEREAQERALEDAVVLESQGDLVAAEAVLNNPAPAPVRYVAPAPVAAQVAQTAGVGVSMTWDFRITNESIIPREYMLVNESAIRNAGKTTKGKVKIAGIEFFEKPVVSASRTARSA